MFTLSVLALVLACAYAVPFGFGGMNPMVGYGGYGMKPMMGVQMGPHSHGHGYDDHDDDLLLNCQATFTDNSVPPNLVSAIAVNIEQEHHDDGYGGMGGMGHGMGHGMGMMGGYGGYGYGGMLGGYGKPGYGGMMGHQEEQGSLSARIEVTTTTAAGTGFIVFTERARPGEGCTQDAFGDVLVNKMRDNHQMGQFGPGMGLGKMAYGMGGYGMGMYGAGHGMGYGMGMGHGSMYGHHGQDGDDDAGIVAEISITPGAITTAVIDNLDFHDLSDLAGRGVVICSEVTYDWEWNPTCEEPYFSCCALKYDDAIATLT